LVADGVCALKHDGLEPLYLELSGLAILIT
jgi:hypothetical protein